MKTVTGISAALILLGGCVPHEPIVRKPVLPISPITLSTEDINLTLPKHDPYCCTLPQELDIELPEYGPKIGDLSRFDQNVNPYLEIADPKDLNGTYDIQNSFSENFFRPWGYSCPPLPREEASWPLKAFKGGYGSNYQPVFPSWFQEISDQSNFDRYGTVNQKGIATQWMSVRALPTDKPLYRNPSEAGEGYPFDLLQNSSVNFYEPVYISHYSKDGAWCYIFTNSVSGWVHSDGIKIVDNKTADTIRQKKQLFILTDNIPLYDQNNRFITYSRIGMVLPYEQSEGNHHLVSMLDDYNQSRRITIPVSISRVGIEPFDKNTLSHLGNQMLKNTYGWGGMLGERDCSSMIRDMMTPFGIWLPRNSSAQAKKGEIISFEGVSDSKKLSMISERGIPFQTILYLKGHVMLYIGTYQNNVMVLHNIWGIRTLDKSGNKGRSIVGKAVVSTLELGSDIDNFDPSMKLLTRLQSMNIFTHPPLTLSRGGKSGKKGKS